MIVTGADARTPEFKEYLRLKREREAAGLREMMAAAHPGDIATTVHTSRGQAYADLGDLGDDPTPPTAVPCAAIPAGCGLVGAAFGGADEVAGQAGELGEGAGVAPVGEVAVDGLPGWGSCGRWRQGMPVRPTWRTARRSCSGRRPMRGPLRARLAPGGQGGFDQR
ncbi:hypothetical protein ABT158_49035 [Nonomuraea sp. NPDC001636]|uniref:hypothetical protein n=1 Tax=Nonomuraea sp. NPDC001636 TaxID=3154391 RepID=UPI00332D4384